ncbi:hypothetical protein NPIL_121161 [Nephila pilipes]|uniref:Uncharacterized protein n=1 Tax=Nephila pilipes TaxID=299642 RepID=A0A8X6MKJ9_NEPPI|nr:hypothetical protein NPIL_121161 [Nephila pilipes]
MNRSKASLNVKLSVDLKQKESNVEIESKNVCIPQIDKPIESDFEESVKKSIGLYRGGYGERMFVLETASGRDQLHQWLAPSGEALPQRRLRATAGENETRYGNPHEIKSMACTFPINSS